MRLLLLPIEPIENRYTEQWTRWWRDGLVALGWSVDVAVGPDLDYSIEHGEFLDGFKTWRWKGAQMDDAARLIKEAQDAGEPYDWVLSLDGWGACGMGIPYIRDVTGAKFKYAMFWHAGVIDDTDLLNRTLRHNGVEYGQAFDAGMIASADLVFCCSESQRKEIENALKGWMDQVPACPHLVALGNPIDTAELHRLGAPVPWSERENLVVFPHRHAPEKQWHLFASLFEVYRRKYGKERPAQFVYSRDVCKTKEQYYNLLGRARCVPSFALQENFGTCVHEALALGCAVLMPNRKVYREIAKRYEQPLFGQDVFGNDNIEEAADKLFALLGAAEGPKWSDHCDQCVARASAILVNRS